MTGDQIDAILRQVDALQGQLTRLHSDIAQLPGSLPAIQAVESASSHLAGARRLAAALDDEGGDQ